MAEPQRCPNCMRELPPNAPQGLCPVCLLGGGPEDETAVPPDGAAQHDLSVSIGPASSSVLARIGEDLVGFPRVLLRENGDEGREDGSAEAPPPGAAGPAGHGERYRIFGEIAHGGMGAVLRGRDTDLGRELAFKVLLESHKGKPELIRRFVEEAQIGGQLQHPGVVPVYDLGTFTDQRPYFTMKW